MSDELIAMAIQGAVIGGSLMIIAYIFQFVVHLLRVTTKAVKKVAKGEYGSEDGALNRLLEEQIYEQVADELAENNQNPATWAKAIEKAEGDIEKAKSFYIKFRVQSIKDEQILRNKAKKIKEAKERDRIVEIEEAKRQRNQNILNAMGWVIIFGILFFLLFLTVS